MLAHTCGRRLPHPPKRSDCNASPELRCSATLGEEPKIELACVMVPICTQNWLRFTARLDDEAPEVRFERTGLGLTSFKSSYVYSAPDIL